MEPPPFYHRRYASPPSSENPNFYNSHPHQQQHRLPPPPPLPPHLRPSFPPLLPSPNSSQLSYRPHGYHPPDYPPSRSFRHSPARDPVPRSLPYYEQNFKRWSPPPRERRLPSPVGSYVDGRDFRFRGEDGYRGREFSTTDYVDDEKYRYSSHRDLERNSNSSSRFERDVEIADSQGVGRMRSYDSYSDRVDDSRRGYSRLGNENEYMDMDGDSAPRELVEYGYNYVGRLKSKIVVQSQEYFNRSPMKQQVQKKSALLRIGKTNNKNQHWNRGQEDSRYPRGYYDEEESYSNLGGNFRGKLDYDFVNREAQIDVKREKSPVELDVSFKSNALVAKAINPPSSYVPESDAFVGYGNNNSKKASTTDSPRMKLNDYFVKASGPSLSSLSSERSHEKLKGKAGSYDGALAHAFRSVSDKDVGHLAGKMPVSNQGSFVGGRTGGTEPMSSIVHNQDVDLIAPDVVDMHRPGKQSCDANSLRPVDDKLSDLDISSTASLSTTSQLEKVEDARHPRSKYSSDEKCATNDVTSTKYVNIASGGVLSDAKEDGIISFIPVSLEHFASISVPSTQGNKIIHGDKLINNEHSRLSSDGGLVEVQNLSKILVSEDTTATFQSHNVDDGSKHSGLKKSSLAEISLVGEARNSVDSNVDALSASNFDQGFCRRPGNVSVVSTDAIPKEFPQYLVSNVSNGNVNTNDSPAGNSSVSLVGTFSSPKLGNLPVHEDTGNNLSSGYAASCTADFANSLENRTLSGLGFLNHNSEQSIVNGETTLSGNSLMEKCPTLLFSDLAMVGRKRKVTDGQLENLPVVSKLARPSADFKDDQDENSIVLGKNNELLLDNGQKSSGKCSMDEGLNVLHHHIKGSKTRVEFSLVQTPLSEPSQTPEVFKPCAESSIIEDLSQTKDTVAHLRRDETILKGLSSNFEAPVILLQENSVAGGSHDGNLTGCVSKPDRETSYNHLNKEKISVAVSSSDLKSNNCLPIEGYQGNSLGPDDNQKPSLGGASCVLPMHDSPASSDSPCPTNSKDGQINSLPDTLSNMGSSDDLSNFSSEINQVSHSCQGKGTGPILAVDEMSFPAKLPPQSSKVGTQSGAVDPALNSKAAASSIWNPSKISRKVDPSLNRLNSSVVKPVPGQISSKYSKAIKVAPSSHIVKPRTWHRSLTAQPLVSEPKLPSNYIHNQNMNLNKDVSKVQGSYVRRGNTLVRKSPQVSDSPKLLTSQSSVYHLSSGVGPGNAGRLDSGPGKQQYAATLAGSNRCLEILKTSPLAGSIRSPTCTSSNPLDLAVSPPANPVNNYCPGETSPSKSAPNVDTKRSLEEDMKFSNAGKCGTVSSNYLDCRSTGDERNLKRKSNPLVAASNSSDVLPQTSDGYVKRRKNQLIRTSLNGNFKHGAVIDDKSSSLQQDSQNRVQIRNSSKRLSGYIKKKFSLVWTLNGTLSSRKDGSSGKLQRVLPNLFPWKRASSWTNHMHCLRSFSNDSDAISQKLRLARKREAIYKRSVNGFSLTRSKVLGVGGSNLKWSKSMEKNSRKVNKEATLAVAAAAEKRKKSQNLTGERIFRIGSERYKMDSTRRTLQRIPDEQSSFSGQSEKKEKKVYVPSRLLIGNDEYVRVGNGNKLVRDPKRRTRILASEKIRWSLHTARLRLARNKQYCQFFTKFGKCKDDKKCRFIHDPSKIAVCTKFLLNSCSVINCKLTHKVIPERMQDCSYFLQGLCSNGSCPYRHVNTNLNAPVCEGFLRGYCAEGDECLKKHTHVCPVFEATRSCQVPECKLHHPKKKLKVTKRRVSHLQKNARGRYFGYPHSNVGHGLTRTVTGKSDASIHHSEEFGGDYIALDIRINEMDLVFEPRSEAAYDREEILSDVEMDEDDESTKPMRLLNKS